MKKLAILLLLTTAVYADNTDAFNNAYQIGKQNQFNLNLNGSSTFDSFGQANKFESNIINDAKTGNATAQPMYNGATNDPNYLYNQGKADIANCQSKNDPRCTSLNKYGDKDTQTQFQAYNQGISSKYSIITKPDPSDKNCTQITRKVPINESTKSCIASDHAQSSCHALIMVTVNSEIKQCDPTQGECTQYSTNPNCTLVQDYTPATCKQYTYFNNYGSCKVGQSSCDVPSTFHTPGCGGSTGRDYVCGTCSTGGDTGDHNGCWGQTCSKWEPIKPAVYQCKYPNYGYSDGCKGFK